MAEGGGGVYVPNNEPRIPPPTHTPAPRLTYVRYEQQLQLLQRIL